MYAQSRSSSAARASTTPSSRAASRNFTRPGEAPRLDPTKPIHGFDGSPQASDPRSQESIDAGPRLPEVRAALREELFRWRLLERDMTTPRPLTLDPEELERLRALGYVP